MICLNKLVLVNDHIKKINEMIEKFIIQIYLGSRIIFTILNNPYELQLLY